MTNYAVRIEHGYHLIDTNAWVRQRTGEPQPELTNALVEFTRHHIFARYRPEMDTAARMQLWCAARGLTSSEETTFYHDPSWLADPASIVLAVNSSDRAAYALVQVGDGTPQVYLDVTTDDSYWSQVEPVDIVCPSGHRWTWLDHTGLLDSSGGYVPFANLFGRQPGAPYAECRTCVAYDDGERDGPCLCESRWTIYCPTCDQRCRLELTDVPTFNAWEKR